MSLSIPAHFVLMTTRQSLRHVNIEENKLFNPTQFSGPSSPSSSPPWCCRHWASQCARGLVLGWLFTIFPKVDFFTGWWMRTIIVLTFSPSGENVNTNMALFHRQVKKRNIPFYIKNDMGPNDSLTDGRKSYDCDEKYHIQNWQEGALFSFTLRWKIMVSLVTFHHLVNI